MEKKWDVIELLRNTRHDWLNTIQLIKGNLALNRLDRIEEIIEDVVSQTRNEAKLSSLEIPLLIEELLTFNWGNHKYRLETEVLGDQLNLSKYQNELAAWCQKFFAYLDACCMQASDNHLLITFQLLEERKVIFDFHGQLKDISLIQEWIDSSSGIMESCEVIEWTISDTEAFIVIELM